MIVGNANLTFKWKKGKHEYGINVNGHHLVVSQFNYSISKASSVPVINPNKEDEYKKMSQLKLLREQADKLDAQIKELS